MTTATDFKFCAQFGHRSTNFQMTNCPRSGRGQGQVANFKILHPRNISGTAKATVVKFCTFVGYIKY